MTLPKRTSSIPRTSRGRTCAIPIQRVRFIPRVHPGGFLILWFIGFGSLAAFLAAAKAHGRQIRLERELAGIWQVFFGGNNPPLVEAIWRRDRTVFWCAFALFLLASAATGIFSSRFQWRIPIAQGQAQGPWWGLALLALLWSFIFAFSMAGMAAVFRTWLAHQAGATQGAEWLAGALWGSLGWWALVFLLAMSILEAARRGAAI